MRYSTYSNKYLHIKKALIMSLGTNTNLYLKSLNTSKIFSLLEQWPIKQENGTSSLGSGEAQKIIIESMSLDFSFLEVLDNQELVELVSLMYVGRENHGRSIGVDIWGKYLTDNENESQEKLINKITGKDPFRTKTQISHGLESIGVGSGNDEG